MQIDALINPVAIATALLLNAVKRGQAVSMDNPPVGAVPLPPRRAPCARGGAAATHSPRVAGHCRRSSARDGPAGAPPPPPGPIVGADPRVGSPQPPLTRVSGDGTGERDNGAAGETQMDRDGGCSGGWDRAPRDGNGDGEARGRG